MKLILIRHGKSAWDNPMADDHARTLTERGNTAASAIGDWLMASGHVPTRILCSDATRTIQTAERLIARLTPAPMMSLHPSLYHASPDTIAELVGANPADTLAVIGHNPGIGMLANGLVKSRPAHHRFSDYPTGATTVIDVPNALTPASGTCLDFVVPRDLTD